jgi:preprotein translocase subunit SecY
MAINKAINIQKKCQVEKNLKLIVQKSSYDKFSLEHRRLALEYQYASSIVIFSIVVIIVLCGLIFSWLEFKKGQNTTTTLKFSQDGVEISSQIIGLIILVISLGFAYLYIDKAYPINEISTQNVAKK